MTSDDDDIFAISVSDAYFVPTISTKHPTFTWHIGCWRPRKEHTVQTSGSKKKNLFRTSVSDTNKNEKISFAEQALFERNILKADLDNIISSIYVGLKNCSNASNVQIFPNNLGSEDPKLRFIVLFKDVYEIILQENLKYSMNKLEDKILNDEESVLLSNDRRSVAIFFTHEHVDYKIFCHLYTEYFVVSTFADIKDLNLYSAKNLIESLYTKTKEKDNENYRKDIYTKFWKDFSNFIYSMSTTKLLIDNSSAFSFVFCDFRGVAVPARITDTLTPKVGYSIDWGGSIVKNMARFIDQDLKTEITASYMANNNVIYMSNLGRKSKGKFRVIDTVRFLVCVRPLDPFDTFLQNLTVSEGQLGRILNRINMLGTVRFAALKNLREINIASQALSDLDPGMRDARAAPTAANVKNARHMFSQITSEFLNSDKSGVGLQFRIERSRYYVSRFRENVKSLRINRVEGYQKYDDLVERKMGDIFDFIDRVGVRYERAANSLSLIEQNYLAIRSEENGTSLKNIQRWSELVLLVFLLPYYIYGFFHYLSEHDLSPEMLASHSQTLMCIIAVSLFIIGVARFFSEQEFSKNILSLIFSVLLYFVLGYMFVVLSGAHIDVQGLINFIWERLTEKES